MSTPAQSKGEATRAAMAAVKSTAGKGTAGAGKTPSEPAEKEKAKAGRKAGQPAREYDMTGLSAELLSKPRQVTREQASQFAPGGARSELQQVMDRVVLNYHRDWVGGEIRDYEKEGHPVTAKTTPRATKWAQMPKARYHISPTAEDGFVALVNKAALFHGLSIKWGQRNVHDTNGAKVMVFAVRDRAERTKEEDAANAESSDNTGGENTESSETKAG